MAKFFSWTPERGQWEGARGGFGLAGSTGHAPPLVFGMEARSMQQGGQRIMRCPFCDTVSTVQSEKQVGTGKMQNSGSPKGRRESSEGLPEVLRVSCDRDTWAQLGRPLLLLHKIMVIPLVRALQKGNTGDYQDCFILGPFLVLIRGRSILCAAPPNQDHKQAKNKVVIHTSKSL